MFGQTQYRVPEMPPRVPRAGNAFLRWLGFHGLRLAGWRITGNLPDVPRMIVIGAPHTSNWDWIISLFVVFALGIRFSYLIKDTVFIWPLSLLVRATGGMPVDRASPAGMVDNVTRTIANTPELILAITPEGTRARVERWKTGFLRIAEAAQLPVVQISWDYPSKTVNLGPEVVLTGDHERDIGTIREYYRQFVGRNPENQSP